MKFILGSLLESHWNVTLNLARKKVKVIATNGTTVYKNDVEQEYWTRLLFLIY